MEKELGLQYLPPEIIAEIASYLDIQDITACWATCSFLRQSLNSNLIWKKFCSFEAVDYFKWGECESGKYLEWERNESKTWQPPLCTWRQHFMMEAGLWSNWKCGNYSTVDFEFRPQNEVLGGTQIIFLENDHVFIHSCPIWEHNTIDEIWSVQKTPFLHSSLNLNTNQYFAEQLNWLDSKTCIISLVNSNLVILLKNLVLIYDVTLSSFSQAPLRHAFFFNGSSEPDSPTSTEPCIAVSGDFLIGAQTVPPFLFLPHYQLTLYQWNMETGVKIKEDHILTTSTIESFSFLCSEDKKHLIVKLRLNKDRYMYHYYGYSISKLEQSQFIIKINYCEFEVFFGDNVIGVGVQKIFLYSYKRASKVRNIKCNQEILKKTIKVVNGYLLFGTFENIVYVINPSNLEVVNKVKLDFTIYSLQPLCDKFVVINSTNCYVWQIGKTAKKLFKLPYGTSFAAVNRYGTKLAVIKGNKIKVLKFW